MRLHRRIKAGIGVALSGLICSLASWLTLLIYLYRSSRTSLYWIGGLYLAVFCAEFIFSKRRWIFREIEEFEETLKE
ncbi:MAG: hypothetical protein L3J49_00655 [Desulfobulbaceae bacterium]|nr:hypothetical protein [Desulfobulbaceae bacterium]